MGNLKSKIVDLTLVLSNSWRFFAVATPSVTSLVSKICAKLSPEARRNPIFLVG
jgi:hypothetical protein